MNLVYSRGLFNCHNKLVENSDRSLRTSNNDKNGNCSGNTDQMSQLSLTSS